MEYELDEPPKSQVNIRDYVQDFAKPDKGRAYDGIIRGVLAYALAPRRSAVLAGLVGFASAWVFPFSRVKGLGPMGVLREMSEDVGAVLRD